jgi:hypothetical protein
VSEFDRITGTIERVFDNATSEGKPYKVIVLDNGERYSLWRKGDFEKVFKGEEIDFDYSRSGRFKNIERIYTEVEDLTGNPDNGPDSGSAVDAKYNEAVPDNVNGNGYGADKLEKMVRMSGLKSAAQIVAACGTKMPFETKVDKTLEAARKFRDYILADEEFELEPPEPPVPAG